ncbi:RICIN domain-containing protein [Amycolatopsis sp. cmx-11-51]|uniref:RICIN domain-containing protein n=1 Tax=unclassified Amycolatopsis TaxID=2618356 RepID=UPI0039E62286
MITATQAPDGFFGPSELRTKQNGHADLWPHMPMRHPLRSPEEYTKDARVVPFLSHYFRFMAAQPASVYTDGWGTTRWSDTIDVVYWLYNRTGEKFPLELVRTIHLWRTIDNDDGWFRLQNRHSGKLLGVDLMSTADSAIVVRFDDNGTADHLWRLLD